MAYDILRVCERLGLTEDRFYAADREEQLRWLAYELLRRREELSAISLRNSVNR